METQKKKIDPESGRMIMTDTIFRKRLGDGDNRPLTLGDLPDDIQPADEIFINYDEGYYSENNSWGPFTEVFVYRDRLETDEERQVRLEEADELKADLKERRRKTFLMLKKEFEPDEQTQPDQN